MKPQPSRASAHRGPVHLPALLIGLCAMTALFGCATQRGIAEFTAYRSAYTSAAQSGQAVLDRLAVAERRVFEASEPPLSVDEHRFEVSKVRYYVDTVDPPVTSSLRASVEVVRAYNEALIGLANGQATDAMLAQLSLVGSTAITAGSQITELAGLPAGNLAGIAAKFVNPLKALEPLAAFALTQRTREEFRQRLLDDHPKIDAVLQGLVAATPDIFEVLARPVLRAKKTLAGTKPLSQAERTGLLELRSALANWVLLLEASRSTLASAVNAVAPQSGAGAGASFFVAAGELQQAALQVRRNLAAMNSR